MSLSICLLENEFRFASSDHYLAVLISILVGWALIRYSKKNLDRPAQRRLMLAISMVPLMSFIGYTMIKLSIGTYDYQKDLPIHLCRLLALTSPIVYFTGNRFWTGVFYFWIVVGTINAVITPELHFGFPHWGYFAYFFMHCFLIILAVYDVVVFDKRIRVRDVWNAFWMSNLLLVLTFLLNQIIGSNYMYTRNKPSTGSLLDFFGPWPWYLVTVQFIGLALFFIAYLPFHFKKKNS